MICFPNAKINLGLNIISRRGDGYHNLETLFYPIGLRDGLEIVPSGREEDFRLFQTGATIQGDKDDNLVIKALKLISEEKKIPGIDIHLFKKIPFGAGLGGGSSDAAFMLKLLNDTFSLGYTVPELEQKAAEIGADCPFFIKNKPAFAKGTGNLLEEVDLDLSSYFFVLVKPDITVSTKEAYSLISPVPPEIPLGEIIQKPVSEWKGLLKNDFEPPIFKKYPEICRIKEQLYAKGAVYASMSGSGSSVYGFFEKETDIRFDNCWVWKNKEL